MANPRTPRSSSDLSEAKSEVGLAEWTSKIKALQRQVDADEEAEQTRLEEEIAASRLARKRRSQGLGYAGRSNLDVSRADSEQLTSIPSDSTKKSMEAQAPQRSGPTLAALTPTTDLKRSNASIDTTTSNATTPMSLAAFMGGSATGPRLKKHAPQQDAHDPTQFQQRSFDRAPHPAFGTGGVALPGIASQRDGPMKPSVITALAKTTLTTRKSETSLNAQLDPLREKQSPAIRDTDVRTRTTSFPSGTKQTRASHTPKPHESQTPSVLLQDRDARSSSPSPIPAPASRLKTPRLHDDETPSSSGSPSRSPYTAPPLAGPIRPQPRPSISGPQIPLSVTPSKAFMRQPAQKELTPSLSRLQGRGFVQSMVKVSSQFESPPAILESPEKTPPVSGKRGHTVLDRWQPNVSSMSSPPPSPTPRLVRRSVTFDPKIGDKAPHPSAEHVRPLKGATSNPSLRQENIPPSPSRTNGTEKNPAVGLGSATTLVVYKPISVESPAIDEFGFKPSRTSRGTILDFPAPSEPLSHPTKERARKPRKRVVSVSSSSIIEEPVSSVDTPQISNKESTSSASIGTTSSDTGAPSLQSVEQRPKKTEANYLQSLDQVRHTSFDPVASGPLIIPSKSISHATDGHRLVRHALPGLVSQQESGRLPLSKPTPHHAPNPGTTDHGLRRRALPGLTSVNEKASEIVSLSQANGPSPPQSPVVDKEGTTLAKHSRIPGTGNRPTVMDIAQSLSVSVTSKHVEESTPQPEHTEPSASVRPRALAPTSGQPEKRRSSYEKYSIVLPPLREEATPTHTPTGTLTRKESPRVQDQVQKARAESTSETTGILSLAISCSPSTDTRPIQRPSLPNVNFDQFLKPSPRLTHESGTTTISVEVLAVTGNTASSLSKDRTIFYDTEVLAIVHRSKSQLSGLVSTSVWGWEGKRVTLGSREQRKLQEIAQRYGTSVNIVQQNAEPVQLVHTLGGVLAIRQGTRSHWTPENTAMHLVRSLGGVVYVDEKDLNIKNLCSGYSYCISILDSVYVWYGRGSTPLERKAALEYGRSLTTSSPPIELTEDDSKDDEMFWMILGEDPYANADYWKWRRNSSNPDPRIWRVQANADAIHVDCLSSEASFHESVYIIDCIWELYVVVGSSARAHKQAIELAFHIASELSARASSTRPYAPTVHTLILPSQIPRDLRMMFRDLDESSVNNGLIPDHMNILSSAEAYKHLETSTWDEYALQDRTMLPLGVGATST